LKKSETVSFCSSTRENVPALETRYLLRDTAM
jgi:hypothetical protein